MSEKTYNGWSSYETWNVALWIDNEEGSYNYWRETARECWEESETGGNRYIMDRADRAQSMLAERMKSELNDDAELPELPGFYADLLNAALGEVNWYELADHYLDDVKEEAETE